MTRTKVCQVEGCGAEFPCGSDDAPGGCWCNRVTVTLERLADLRVRYTDCLCLRHLPETPVPTSGDEHR